jgi:hypothetical protein
MQLSGSMTVMSVARTVVMLVATMMLVMGGVAGWPQAMVVLVMTRLQGLVVLLSCLTTVMSVARPVVMLVVVLTLPQVMVVLVMPQTQVMVVLVVAMPRAQVMVGLSCLTTVMSVARPVVMLVGVLP